LSDVDFCGREYRPYKFLCVSIYKIYFHENIALQLTYEEYSNIIDFVRVSLMDSA